jgi:DNA-binding NarL/FixJ family response regulator
LHHQEFDLIIVAQVMPGKSGTEFNEFLSSREKFNRMKIILIPSYLQQDDVLSAIEKGVRNIIIKTFNHQQTASQVAELFNLSPDDVDNLG